ncbi:MAG: hypothetical protein AAF974_04800 [Cyanobacteria bacterium P01_E01_bin.34]
MTTIIAGVLAALSLLLIGFELRYRSRQNDAIEIEPRGWSSDRIDPNCYRLSGTMVATNHNPLYECTLADISPSIKLLGSDFPAGITTTIRFTNPEFPRSDNYWSATLIGPKTSLPIEFTIDICGDDLGHLKVAWLKLDFIQYGRQQRIEKSGHAIIPLTEPEPTTEDDWQQRDGALVLPIRTPLLTNQDSQPAIVEQYVKPFSQSGDYLILAETATAIVEDNFRYPGNIRPGWLARRLCFFFPSKTSLCSAYGMQTLIDTSNAWQVAFAFILGSGAKLVGISGVFYALAGYQAALIDDVTGTISPYDQFIVLGPANPNVTVATVKEKTGMETAIVDANDLKEVKILASTSGVNAEQVVRALRENPAGNADEQTPILLVRPNP